jgi:hypothetical protein
MEDSPSNDEIRAESYTERAVEMAAQAAKEPAGPMTTFGEIPLDAKMKALADAAEARFNTMMFGPQGFGVLPANVGTPVSLEQAQLAQLQQQGLVTWEQFRARGDVPESNVPQPTLESLAYLQAQQKIQQQYQNVWPQPPMSPPGFESPPPPQSDAVLRLAQYGQWIKATDILDSQSKRKAPRWDVACEAVR